MKLIFNVKHNPHIYENYINKFMIIKRKMYLDKINPFIDKDIIKVIIGPMRCGKSTILKQIIDSLIKKGIAKENIVLIDFEVNNFPNIKTLEDYISKKIENTSGKIYLFFDEIESVPQWGRLINSYFAKKNYDIYITSSNSQLLFKDYAMPISGKYVKLNIYPFSFKEYVEYHKIDSDFKTHFYNYLENGGMPSTFNCEKASIIDLYNSTVLRETIQKNNVNKIMKVIMENIGQPLSVNKIYTKLKQDLSINTVYKYLKFLENAYLIYSVKYGNLKKYYLSDLGLRQIITKTNKKDINKIIENIVYLELLTRGYEITIGESSDFVCKKYGEIIYIQVSYILASEETIKSKFNPLKKIEDNYPKYVITLDDINMSHTGIKHLNLIDFLLNTEL